VSWAKLLCSEWRILGQTLCASAFTPCAKVLMKLSLGVFPLQNKKFFLKSFEATLKALQLLPD
jgi:hypothetical protein